MYKYFNKSVVFLLSLFAILSYSCLVQAQITFQKALLTSNLHEVKQTADSGYIAVGWNNLPGTQDIILIKTNAIGDTLWTKIYGESEDVIGLSVDLTNDGGYIIVGGTYPTALENPKVYLIKTNSLGDTLWTKKYGGSGTEWGREVHQTYDGGYIIAGETNSFGAWNDDIYVIKTDSVGNVQWSRALGGANNDRCYSICQTSDSNFVAVGTYNAFSTNSDIVIIKFNSIGDTLWSKSYGGILAETGNKIRQTFDKGFAIAGATMSSGIGSSDFLLLTTDSIGNLILFKTYGESDGETAHCIAQTLDGGYVMSGNTSSFGVSNSVSYLVKTDFNGNLVWSGVYNTIQGGIAWDIVQTMDGGFITAGGQNELMKLDHNGISGCLENSAATLNTTSNIQQLNPAISLTTPNTLTTATVTTIGSGVSILTYCLSVSNYENTSVSYFAKLFPNPVNNFVTIQTNLLSLNAELELYNILGERILSEKITEGQTILNCSQFSNGVYFVKMFDKERQFIEKLIINHDL